MPLPVVFDYLNLTDEDKENVGNSDHENEYDENYEMEIS